MRSKGLAAGIALAMLVPAPAIAGAARGALAAVLGDIDRQFTCPEYLPDDDARKAELAMFARTLSGLKLSFAQASHVRAKMLDRHNCSRDGTVVAQPAPPPVPAMKQASAAAVGTGLPH